MRITKLDLLAYGPFRDHAFDLSAPGMHLVFGRNEAGKSTTLRAITGLLYGIDATDAHGRKTGELRVAGTLAGETGETVRIIRRGGRTNTLFDAHEKPIDDGVVMRFLRGVSKETFRHAFGLDHETLRHGAEALLEGKGDLGESLFDASVGGGGGVQRLLADLSDEADRLWRPRGSALPLNDALKSFTEAQKAVREKQSLPEAHEKQQRELAETQAARAEKTREKAELMRRRSTLDRARRRVPLEKKRAAAAEERRLLEAIARDAPAIAALGARIGDHERALAEKRDLAIALERITVRVEEASRRAGIPADDARRIDGPRETRIQRFVAERTKLETGIEAARAEIDRAARKLTRLREEPVAASKEEGDVGALARALERARSLGDLDTRIEGDRARLARRAKELATKAAALGGHALALDALVAVRLPDVAAVDAIAKKAAAADKTIARSEDALNALANDVASLERQLAQHTGDFTPPNARELREARARRDDAWTTLKSERSEKNELAYERLVREADVLVDRMLGEADRVTLVARLRREHEDVVARRDKAEADLVRLRADRTRIEEELRALFSPAGVTPSDAPAMRTWLDRHAQIALDHADLVEAQADLAHAETRLDHAKRELAAALGVADVARLSELVAEAARRVKEIDDAARAREENAKARLSTEEELAARTAATARDAEALADVRKKLAELVAPLAVADDASAEEIARALKETRELFGAVDERARADASLRAIDAEIGAFEADVAALAKPDGRSALETARALSAKRARVEELDRDLATLDEQLRELGGGDIPEDLEAIAGDASACAVAVEELDGSLEVIERELESLSRRIGGIEKGIDEMRGDSNAADAAAQAQEALARVRTNVEKWCRAKLAAVILAREIERYRDENKGPLLGRASALFARLTLGAFAGMKAGFDEKDRPSLCLMRSDGAEVDVTALSEGTRDQLYLSLRLASVLRYAELAEPMPLVLDDVLVHFDDERSAAALSVLAEVARTVQVLFFTHHARLVELARSAIAPSELVVHEIARAPLVSVVQAPVVNTSG